MHLPAQNIWDEDICRQNKEKMITLQVWRIFSEHKADALVLIRLGCGVVRSAPNLIISQSLSIFNIQVEMYKFSAAKVHFWRGFTTFSIILVLCNMRI